MALYLIEADIPTTDLMAFNVAYEKLKAAVAETGWDIKSIKAKWLYDVAATAAQEAEEEAAMNASGEPFGPNKTKPSWVPEYPPEITGWRKVNAWDGQKDPTEKRQGKYRQGWNADGTLGSVEFLPDGEEGK